MKGIRRYLAFSAAAALLASTAGAQTTGRIVGKVVDVQGGALPGVTVTATSPNSIGEKAVVTEADGGFRFFSLSPGTYSVEAKLEGFQTARQDNVAVGIDRTATLELQLSSEISETIQVTSEGPLVDVTNTETGLSVGADVFEKLPTQRNFYAVAQLAPGTGTDTFGTTVSGATSAENQYVIEGLNTTGVELGIEGKQLNFDFIQEVEVKTGGLNAEYGRMTGGVVNAVTKSGGNQFAGDVFGYYSGGSLREDDDTASRRPGTTTQIVDIDSQQDYGFGLGGYIMKDRLWFYAAYNKVDQKNETTVIRQLTTPGSPGIGSVIDADIESDFYAGKLTWSINSGNTATVSIFGDPATRDGNVFNIAGPASTWDGKRETGSDDYVLRYDGVFGGSWVLEGLFGRHQEEDITSGPGKFIPQVIDQRTSPNPVSGGFGFHSDDEFQRDVYKLTVAKFLGNHELKAGADLEKLDATTARWNGGAGERIFIRNGGPNGFYYRHRVFLDDTVPGFDRNNPATWVIAGPLVSEPNTDNTAAFLQDSWRVADNFTLNLGARWERQEVKNRFGETAFDIDDAWAGRIGAIWDVMGNGRSKLYANYGRYFESIPMDINIRAFGGEVTCFCHNFDPTPGNITPNPLAPRGSLLGGQEPVDPDLKGQYVDEYLLGFEYEIAPNFSLGVGASYRELGRAVEDFLIISEGNYFIANPGEGLGTEVTMFDYSTAPAPPATREYTAVTFTARKRFSDRWQMIASYVWSELEGNYDGAFQVSTGQLDPNINSAYDYGDFLINSFGDLSLQQQHVVKLDASYLFDFGLNVGASAFWRSGFPLNAYGFNAYYANWENYLVPRGSVGTGPSSYELDLTFAYPIELGGSGMKLNVQLDVFNVLDRQSITRLDERYNLNNQSGCSGIPAAICNADPNFGGIANVPGTTNPVGTIDNPRATATNPDYLKAGTAYTQPRTARLGVKLSF